MQKYETTYFYFTIYKTNPNPKGKNLTIRPDTLAAKRKSRQQFSKYGSSSTGNRTTNQQMRSHELQKFLPNK